LEGLEISEVKLSAVLDNKDARIDSTFYVKMYPQNHNYVYSKIGQYIDKCYYGMSIGMNEEGRGYQIYRMNELHNMLVDLEANKYADVTQNELQPFELEDEDVLFNRTNSYEFVGRTAIYYRNDDIARTFASYLVCFKPNKEFLLPEYLTAYLNTKQGISEIKRRSRQSINQTNVNPEEVKEIEIPLLPMYLQEKLKANFVEANKLRNNSTKLYSEAQKILLQALGLENWQQEAKNSSVKKFLDVQKNGRLDSEYYQPKYQEIEEKLCENRTCRVCDCFAQNKTVSDYSKDTYKYIEIGDIDVSTGVAEYNILPTNELPANAKIAIKNGDVLVSKVRPNRGAVAIINYEFDDLISSGAFTVLQETGGMKKEVLQLLLRTEIYRDLLLKWNVGSSYPVIKDEDVMNLVIPVIDEAIQCEIAQKVQESFALREESNRLLEAAKTAVEMAIEKDEAAALEYLHSGRSI